MAGILHRVGVRTPTPEKVYDALTTVDGLAGWWTDDTKGSSEVGGTLEFRFPPVGGFDMEVTDLRPPERVSWRVSGGPGEWVGTTKWGSFLMSLKSLVETGEGAPSPRDVQISDWH